MKSELKRRDLLLGATAARRRRLDGCDDRGCRAEPVGGSPGQARTGRSPTQLQTHRAHFRFGLNTSTIRGQKLPIVEEVAIAAEGRLHGYRAVDR